MSPRIDTFPQQRACPISTVYSALFLQQRFDWPDIDWSVHDSPDQSEKTKKKKKKKKTTTTKGLNCTGALILCGTLLVKTCCQNDATESQKV